MWMRRFASPGGCLRAGWRGYREQRRSYCDVGHHAPRVAVAGDAARVGGEARVGKPARQRRGAREGAIGDGAGKRALVALAAAAPTDVRHEAGAPGAGGISTACHTLEEPRP